MDITIKDLEGWQVRYIVKLVDMMKAAEQKKYDVERINGKTIRTGRSPKYPETYSNCYNIYDMINDDTLY